MFRLRSRVIGAHASDRLPFSDGLVIDTSHCGESLLTQAALLNLMLPIMNELQDSPALDLKRKFSEGKVTYGVWVTLESPTITEIAARLGFDWIVIDSEHGHLDMKNLMEHVRVANLMGVVCLVGITETQIGLIKRVLDIGADGIIVPQINTAEEVAQAVSYAKYPPEGVRGIGGERATRWGKGFAERVTRANREVFVIPKIETVAAGKAIDSIMEVAGVDAFFFGPADYSASAGSPGEWEGPGVAEQLMEIHQKMLDRKMPSGIIARNPEEAATRTRQKFQMIALGIDTGLLIRAATEAMEAVGRPVPPGAWR